MKKKTTTRDNLIYLAVAFTVVLTLVFGAYFYPNADPNGVRTNVVIRIVSMALAIGGALYGSIHLHKTEIRKARFWAILITMLILFAFVQWHLITAMSRKPDSSLLLIGPELFVFLVVLRILLHPRIFGLRP